MPVGTDYNIGSDPALWPPQGPMQGMAGGSGAPYPMNPGTPYNQGSLDVGGYPGNQPQRTPMSMRICRNLCYTYHTVGNFRGSNFSWFGSTDYFVGLYFHGTPTLIIYIV